MFGTRICPPRFPYPSSRRARVILRRQRIGRRAGLLRRQKKCPALHRADDGELLGLMSYELDQGALAVEIIYIESAAHSNANLLRATGQSKKYIGIARALIAYAAKASVEAGFDGVLFFKAKTDELRKYYMQEFGAMPVGHYDPYRLVIWEDAAANILSDFEEV